MSSTIKDAYKAQLQGCKAIKSETLSDRSAFSGDVKHKIREGLTLKVGGEDDLYLNESIGENGSPFIVCEVLDADGKTTDTVDLYISSTIKTLYEAAFSTETRIPIVVPTGNLIPTYGDIAEKCRELRTFDKIAEFLFNKKIQIPSSKTATVQKYDFKKKQLENRLVVSKVYGFESAE